MDGHGHMWNNGFCIHGREIRVKTVIYPLFFDYNPRMTKYNLTYYKQFLYAKGLAFGVESQVLSYGINKSSYNAIVHKISPKIFKS